jgi:putative nucleotidyltransferase with HDIG domain
MKRISEQSLLLAGAVLLSLIAQDLLLASAFRPTLTRWLTGSDSAAGTLVAAGYFLAGLAVLACIFRAPGRVSWPLALVSGGLALVSLAGAYGGASFFIEALICLGLALGLFAAILPPSWLSFPDPTAWLRQVATALNALVGFLLLVIPAQTLRAHLFIDVGPWAGVLGLIFASSALAVFLGRRRKTFTESMRGRTLMIPWLIWCGILIFQRAEASLLIPPLTLTAVLLLADLIPYAGLVRTDGDTGIPRVFLPTCIGLAGALALLTALARAAAHSLSSPTWSGIVLFCSIAIYLGGVAFIGMTNLTTNKLAAAHSEGRAKQAELSQYYQFMWEEAARDLVRPYDEAAKKASERLHEQEAELEKVMVELSSERRRLRQVNLVAEVDQALEPVLDQPVSAQLTANILQRRFDAALVTVLNFDSARNELVLVAGAGKLIGTIPTGYRQSIQRGMAGRAARLRKTQFAPDTRQDPDHFSLENQTLLCEAAVPVLDHGQIKGMIMVSGDEPNTLSSKDVSTIEIVSERLVSAWQHSSYDSRLRELIQAGIILTGTLETETALREIASTVQRILEARFVFVTLTDTGGGFRRSAYAGYAPRLLNQLTSPEQNALLEYVLNSAQVFRLRDVRTQTEQLELDTSGLRTLLATPIRLRGMHIGAVLAFGKQGSAAFSEEDESLASLIGNQAAAAIETTWLYQQLRSALSTATLLYELSTNILQAEELTDAAATIAQTAYKLGNADEAGIVLYTSRREIEAQVEIDANGLQPGNRHPLPLIKQSMQTGQIIFMSAGEKATICLPLQTPHRQYGGMWLNIPEDFWHKEGYADNLQTLANQAALALERGILLDETRQQKEQIRHAFNELEVTYDQTLIALTVALDARDRETEGHSVRVSKLTYMLGRRVGLTDSQLKLLERGALLHDIGKIGISDKILLKPGPLDDEEWHLMRQHPDIGARIIEGIPFLQEALPVIRYHQERWNGSGYPMGLKGNEIPLQARIFAVADVFDALTSHRPYRNRQTPQEALTYLREQAGIQFDPDVVDALVDLVSEGEILEHIIQ